MATEERCPMNGGDHYTVIGRHRDGASSGIGEAQRAGWRREGMRVTLAARRQDELERVARDIEAGGGQGTHRADRRA